MPMMTQPCRVSIAASGGRPCVVVAIGGRRAVLDIEAALRLAGEIGAAGILAEEHTPRPRHLKVAR